MTARTRSAPAQVSADARALFLFSAGTRTTRRNLPAAPTKIWLLPQHRQPRLQPTRESRKFVMIDQIMSRGLTAFAIGAPAP